MGRPHGGWRPLVDAVLCDPVRRGGQREQRGGEPKANRHRCIVCPSSCWLLIRSSGARAPPPGSTLGDTVASLGLQPGHRSKVSSSGPRACIAGLTQAALHHTVRRSSYRQASVGLAACAVSPCLRDVTLRIFSPSATGYAKAADAKPRPARVAAPRQAWCGYARRAERRTWRCT